MSGSSYTLAVERTEPVKLHALVAGAAVRRCARAALPARRALGRAVQRAAHAPHARPGLLGARHRLPRLRPEHAPPCRPRPRALRRRARGLGTGWRASIRSSRRYIFGHSLGGAIAVQLASRGRRRRRPDRRRQLHLDPRRGPSLEVGLAAGDAADHAALRRRLRIGRVRRAGAGRARQRGPADPARRSAARCTSARTQPKRFVLVEGGTHHNTNARRPGAVPHARCRRAVRRASALNVTAARATDRPRRSATRARGAPRGVLQRRRQRDGTATLTRRRQADRAARRAAAARRSAPRRRRRRRATDARRSRAAAARRPTATSRRAARGAERPAPPRQAARPASRHAAAADRSARSHRRRAPAPATASRPGRP